MRRDINNNSKNNTGIRIVDQNCILNENDILVVCNTTGNITIHLVAASGSSNIYTIKNINTGIVTVLPDTIDTIDGGSGEYIYQWGIIGLVDYTKGKWLLL